MKIDYDKAVRLFEYDDACGCLRWKVSPRYLVNAGDKVGSQGKAGYITTKVEGVSYKVHRLIWLVCNGAMPDGEIDHVDRDKTNNHISNLRVVSRSTNCANRGVFSSSASGKRGIRQLPSGRWGVRIYYEKTVFNLGVFESADDAVTMRNGAEKILRG